MTAPETTQLYSAAFNTTEPREQHINPSCYGDDLANWLKPGLSSRGVQTAGEPGQEEGDDQQQRFAAAVAEDGGDGGVFDRFGQRVADALADDGAEPAADDGPGQGQRDQQGADHQRRGDLAALSHSPLLPRLAQPLGGGLLGSF